MLQDFLYFISHQDVLDLITAALALALLAFLLRKKDFVKPSFFKIILTTIVFFLSYFVQRASWKVLDYWEYGFPFPFQKGWGPCRENCQSFNWANLLIDVAIWYFVVSLLVTAVGKFKKRKKEGEAQGIDR